VSRFARRGRIRRKTSGVRPRPKPRVDPVWTNASQGVDIDPEHPDPQTIMQLQRISGNQAVLRLLKKHTIQRQDATAENEQTPLEIAQNELSDFFVDETLVIEQIKKMNATQQQMFFASAYNKRRALKALSFSEMREAAKSAKAVPLVTRLEWLKDAALIEGALSYSDIELVVKTATLADGKTFAQSEEWRDFFIRVCNNETIFDALRDLKMPPQAQLSWLFDEWNVDDLLGGLDPSRVYDLLKDNPDLTEEQQDNLLLYGSNHWDESESKTIKTLMANKRNDRVHYPVDTTLDEAAQAETDDAQAILDRWKIDSSTVNDLRDMQISMFASELYTLSFNRPSTVRQVIELLAAPRPILIALLNKFELKEEVQRVAADPAGRDLLLRLVKNMPGFWKREWGTIEGVNINVLQEIMKVITDVDNMDREKDGKTSEVEVITFLYGNQGFDETGEDVGHHRGHTALIVNGMVYTYEDGWEIGLSKAQYLKKNEYRDGIGHVLDIPEHDVKPLQNNLNNSLGEGTYAVANFDNGYIPEMGEICTGATTQKLEKMLPHVQNPQLLAGYLEVSDIVKARNYYPRQTKP